MPLRAPLRPLLLALLLAPIPVLPATAQQSSEVGWGVTLAPTVGIEFDTERLSAGGTLRLHLPEPGWIGFQGAGIWTFLDGLTERQLHAEVLFMAAGLAVGGGPVWLHTVEVAGEPKTTLSGWSLVFLAGGRLTDDGSVFPAIEFRLSDVDAFSPRHLTVGVGFPIRF